jgi:hypothetical protein
MEYLDQIPPENPVFTGKTKFSLPKDAIDKRQASWEHVIRNLSRHIPDANSISHTRC